MSVFTAVSQSQLSAFLDRYAVGELRDFQGIEEGIENTNYFVDTSGGRFVLTLFERTEADGLPFFLGIMAHLAAAGIPCAAPQADRDGHVLQQLNGRPAALVQRLPGRGLAHPQPRHCAQVGAVLARMHLSGQSFAGRRANCRGASWREGAARQLNGHLARDEAGLLDDELRFQAAHVTALPGGVIHADLFRDNALFDGDQLSGLIDFYYACTGPWLYDLAVLVNDWTLNAGDGFDAPAYSAVIEAYAAQRAPQAAERAAWNTQLRAAALRFWLSRLLDLHFPRAGELTYTKDPAEFRRILEFHRARALEL